PGSTASTLRSPSDLRERHGTPPAQRCFVAEHPTEQRQTAPHNRLTSRNNRTGLCRPSHSPPSNPYRRARGTATEQATSQHTEQPALTPLVGAPSEDRSTDR